MSTTRKECKHCTVVKSYIDAKAEVHALVEALEKFAKLENATQYFDELVYNDWVPLSLDAKNLANQIGREATEALLATHTQEEAPEDKDTAHIAIDDNKVTETTVCPVCRQPSDQCDGGLKKMTKE